MSIRLYIAYQTCHDFMRGIIISNLHADEMFCVILFAPYVRLASNSHIFRLRYVLSASEKFDKYYGRIS